jgi:DNA-binding response OmpR family regulator
MAAPLIAIANHAPVFIQLLDEVLTDVGFETVQLRQGSGAHAEIKKRRPDLIILDTWLESREAGWMLFEVLRLDRETKEIPVLICSSDLDEIKKRAATLEGHSRVGVLIKPFGIDVFIARVRQMLSESDHGHSSD